MAEINPLGPSSYFAGIQNASSEAAKTKKQEKTASTNRTKFSDIFKTNKEEPSEVTMQGYPAEIENLSVEEAAIYLKDQVDLAGDLLSQELNNENVEKFKKSVQLFIRYVVDHNYEVTKKKQRGFTSPLNNFGNYNFSSSAKSPRVQIQTINQKLDELTKGMLYNQRDNINILARSNEIKGLIVDFLSS